MIRRRLNYVGFSLRLVTFFLPVAAFGLATYVRFTSGWIRIQAPYIDYREYFTLLLLSTIVWAIVAEQYGLCRIELLYLKPRAIRAAFWACTVTYIVIVASTFFYRSASFSRLFVVISAAGLLFLAALTQFVFRAILEHQRARGGYGARVLIVGADDFAARAADSLLKGMVFPCTIAGFARLPGQQVAISGYSVMEFDDIETRLSQDQIDDVIIALSPAELGKVPSILAKLEHFPVPIRAILNLGEGVLVREALFDIGGVSMLDLRATPSESVAYLVLKRGFDIILAALALVLAMPLMLAIAIAIRLTSRGPIFFAQERVGLNGRLFRMYKFRTMKVGNSNESDTRWTTEDDPRRTRLGTLLRRTNLDEVPQFFNVLKGEMSVVGPRPERPYFVQNFMREVAQYNTRHYLKVGITGWAQVNGWRGDTSIARRVEHDLYYLRNWSLMLDLKIVLLTIWRTVFVNKNAY